MSNKNAKVNFKEIENQLYFIASTFFIFLVVYVSILYLEIDHISKINLSWPIESCLVFIFIFLVWILVNSGYKIWKKKYQKDIKNNQDYNEYLLSRNTFGVKGGLVRIFIIVVFLASFYEITNTSPLNQNDTFPLALIISLNIILIYYNLKPKDLLPSSLVYEGTIEKPTNKSLLINSFPKLKSFIDSSEKQLTEQLDNIIGILKDVKKIGQNEFSRLKTILDDLNRGFNIFTTEINKPIVDLKTTISDKYTVIKGQITELKTIIENSNSGNKFFSKYDQIAIVIISFLLPFALLRIPDTQNDQLAQFIVAGLIGAIGLATGDLINKSFFNKNDQDKLGPIKANLISVITQLEDQLGEYEKNSLFILNQSTDTLTSARRAFNDDIDSLKSEVDKVSKSFGDLIDAIIGSDDDTDKVDSINGIKSSLKKSVEEFYNGNILSNFSADVSGGFTIGLLTFFFLLSYVISTPTKFIGIDIPVFDPEYYYSLLLWFVSYYFATKK